MDFDDVPYMRDAIANALQESYPSLMWTVRSERSRDLLPFLRIWVCRTEDELPCWIKVNLVRQWRPNDPDLPDLIAQIEDRAGYCLVHPLTSGKQPLTY